MVLPYQRGDISLERQGYESSSHLQIIIECIEISLIFLPYTNLSTYVFVMPQFLGI